MFDCVLGHNGREKQVRKQDATEVQKHVHTWRALCIEVTQTGTLGEDGGSSIWSGGLELGIVSKAQGRTTKGTSTERDLSTAQ